MRIVAAAMAAVCGLLAGRAEAGLSASADIVSSAGSYYPYHYDLTLHNTGTQSISTFWFAWDDSQLNFLPNYPYPIYAPAGWYPLLTSNYGVSDATGYGIEWYDYDGNPLAPGAALTGFSFESYDDPSVIGGISSVPPVNPGDAPFPVATSFVYDHYPVADGDEGFQFITGASGAAPEPASLGLLGAGAAGLLLRRRRNSH